MKNKRGIPAVREWNSVMITARLTEKEYIIQIVPNTVQEKKKRSAVNRRRHKPSWLKASTKVEIGQN